MNKKGSDGIEPDLFDRTSFYCINLDARTDRWARVQHQFGLIGIREKVARVSAVTDCIIHNSLMSKAEQSLIETNLRIFGQADLSGPICIFEDDVYFLMEYWNTGVMACVSEQLPDDFGLLYLGAHLFDPIIKHPLISPNLVQLLPELRPTKEKEHVFVGGAHAVVFSKKAIEYIRSLPADILFEKQWDIFLSKHIIPRFPCFMAYPAFAFQVEDVSDIEGKQTKRNWIIEHNRKAICTGMYSRNSLIRLGAKIAVFIRTIMNK